MKSNNPIISVFVITYNQEATIARTLDSILVQKHPYSMEVVIGEDCSTDKTRAICETYVTTYPDIFRLLDKEENKGVVRNVCDTLKECRGKYLAGCAGDDFWIHDKIEKQIQYMILNPECPMCYSKCYYIDDNSHILTNKNLYKSEKKFKGGSIFEDILLVNFHLPVSYLFTREILEQENYFHDGVICEDFYMNLKISNKYKIGYINERLFYYRYAQKSEERIKSVIASQKDIIDQYSESMFYKKAVENWKLRALESFSGNKNFKSDFFKQLWDINEKNHEYYGNIINSNSVSIHVRRGDYLIYDNFGTCDENYFKSAIKYINDKESSPKYFVFSDDMEWIKMQTFIEGLDVTFVEGNVDDLSYIDMHLMSLCKHNIISNSSFSWWGAWLNRNVDKKVIAPARWFSDEKMNNKAVRLVPESWIRF